MKNVILIPKDKSSDMKLMQNLLNELCAETMTGSHACCSGDSLEFRIEEEHIQNFASENVYKVIDGKLTNQS
jgi:hypothetical protein